MKNAPFDINKFITVLVNGDDSYSDGRYDFDHENLCRVLDSVGIKLNLDFVHAEAGRRSAIRNKRYKQKRSNTDLQKYVFTLVDNSDNYLDALVANKGRTTLPINTYTDVKYHDEPSMDATYTYETYGRESAAKILTHIKKFHATRTSLKTTTPY